MSFIHLLAAPAWVALRRICPSRLGASPAGPPGEGFLARQLRLARDRRRLDRMDDHRLRDMGLCRDARSGEYARLDER